MARVGDTDAPEAVATQQEREVPGVRADGHEGAAGTFRPHRPVGPERRQRAGRPEWPDRPIRSAR